MTILPTKLERQGDDFLLISWSDGQRRRYAISELRKACPCATCREKRTAAESKPAQLFPILSVEETQPVRLVGLKPVGSYAYSAEFSDGHDSGIFSFDSLRQLGEIASG